MNKILYSLIQFWIQSRCWKPYFFLHFQITKLKIDSNPFAKGFRDSTRLTEFERYEYVETIIPKRPLLNLKLSLGMRNIIFLVKIKKILSGFFGILLSLRKAMVIIAFLSKHTAFSLSARRWALITATHWCIGRGWSPWCSTTPTLGLPGWGPTQRPIWRRRSNSTGNSCPKVSPPISPCQKVNPPIYCLNH